MWGLGRHEEPILVTLFCHSKCAKVLLQNAVRLFRLSIGQWVEGSGHCSMSTLYLIEMLPEATCELQVSVQDNM